MASDIVNYIKSQLEKGLSRDQVKQILSENKWKENDINNAFIELDQELKKLEEAKKFAPPPPITNAASEMKLDNLGNAVEIKYEEEIVVEKHQKIDGPFSIVSQAIKLYFSHFLRLMALSLITFIIMDGAIFLTETTTYQTFVTNYNISFISGFFIFLFCVIILLELYSLMLSSFIKKSESSYEKRTLRSFSYLWLIFLQILASVGILVITASLVLIMGFILNKTLPSFIIGGIVLIITIFVFNTWFFFSTFAFLENSVTAMEALSIARSLTKNKWFFLIISYLVFIIVFILLSVIILLPFLLIFDQDAASSLVYVLFGFPFTISYYSVLYYQLQGNLKETDNSSFIRNFALICSLGVIIIAGMAIWAASNTGVKGIGNNIKNYALLGKLPSTNNLSGSNETEQKHVINNYNLPEKFSSTNNLSGSNKIEQTQEKINKFSKDEEATVVALTNYFNKYKKYPDSIEELVSNGYISSIPINPLTNQKIIYDTIESGARYMFCQGDHYSRYNNCYGCYIFPLVTNIYNDPEQTQKIQIQLNDIKNIRYALLKYYFNNKKYPTNLEELSQNYISFIPTPPNRRSYIHPEHYNYKTIDNQQNYRIFLYFNDNLQCYLDSNST